MVGVGSLIVYYTFKPTFWFNFAITSSPENFDDIAPEMNDTATSFPKNVKKSLEKVIRASGLLYLVYEH